MRPLHVAFTVGLIVGACLISMSVLGFTAYVTANYPDVSTNDIIRYSKASSGPPPMWTPADRELMDKLGRELDEEIEREEQWISTLKQRQQ